MNKVACLNCGRQADSATLGGVNHNGFHVRVCEHCGYSWNCDAVTGEIFGAGMRMDKRISAPSGVLFVAKEEEL
jgi:predicted nucleic-acid-binding Zn-ribbon protein